MSFRPALYMLMSAVLLTTVMTSVSSAQWNGSRQTSLRPLRFLGQGWGAGYHHCNPGPNVDYYNPYSAHNSALVSQGGLMAGSDGGYQSYSMDSGSVPFPGYSPSPVLPSGNFDSHPGESIEAIFQGSTPEVAAPPSDIESSNSDEAALAWPKSSSDGSNDFQPASFSRATTEAQRSAADWSIEDPFDISNK